MIEPDKPFRLKTVPVLGKKIAYVDEGKGDPIVFLHGNPTSSYLWRNVIRYAIPYGRCLAPDLIGMGQSDKIHPSGDASYRFPDLQLHLDIFMELTGALEGVTLVVHEFGSMLGFDWARRHGGMKRIIYTEAIVQPLRWSDWPEDTRDFVKTLRTPFDGDKLALEDNQVVEFYLRNGVRRLLKKREIETYSAPYRKAAEHRRPTLNMFRELPIDGEPLRVVELVERYGEWLAQSEIPKLFINVDPGYLLTGKPREFCRTWPNQVEVTVEGLHYPQEDSPRMMATEIIRWLQSNPS